MNFGKVVKKELPNVIEIPNPPTDTVSDIVFNSESTLLAVGSWDGTVRIYEISQINTYSYNKTKNFMPLNMCPFDSPVLSLTFVGNNLFAGFADGKIALVCTYRNIASNISANMASNISANVELTIINNIINPHSNGVKSLKPFNNSYLISGSFDSFVKIFDMTLKEVHSINCNAKVYCLDICEDTLAVGLSNKTVLAINLTTLKQEIIPTKFQYGIRSISIHKSRDFGMKITVGSVEAKIEVLSASNHLMNNPSFVFKCHRIENKLYSVNKVLSYGENKVISGGSDGNIVVFNKVSRFKVASGEYGSPITAMALSDDGVTFVFATGDDWSKGYSRESIPVLLKCSEFTSIKNL